MASISQVHTRKAPKGSIPISAHPAFPLVVALWFAALLGLGSFVLPVTMIEQLVNVTGIAELLPAAAPPLGVTARMAIALVAAGLGAALGLYAARRIKPNTPEQPRRRSFKREENQRRQPLNAHEELGSTSFDSVAGFAVARRRALAGEENGGKSDLFQAAPLPGHTHGHGFAYAEQVPEPLDLEECAEFTEIDELEESDANADEEIAMSQRQVFSVVPSGPDANNPLPFSPPSMTRQMPQTLPEEIEEAVFEQFPPQDEADQNEANLAMQQDFIAPDRNLAPPQGVSANINESAQVAAQETDLELVQLVQKLGATLEKHREWTAQRSEQTAKTVRFPRAINPNGFGEDDFAVAAPDEAAKAMATFFAPPTASEPHAFTGPEVLEDKAASPVTALRQEFMPGSIPQPAVPQSDLSRQLRPFAGLTQIDDADFDEDLDKLAASFSLPLHRAVAPAAYAASPKLEIAPALDSEAGQDVVSSSQPHTTDNDAYSSLLGMKNPFRDHRPEFVRIEEPDPEFSTAQPSVVFPNEAPATISRAFDRPSAGNASALAGDMYTKTRTAFPNDDSDRLLREALSNLQRIGKN